MLFMKDVEDDKQYVLLRWSNDYADEFDMEGFVIITEQDYLAWKDYYQAITNRFEIYFGTNEYFEYSNGQNMIDCTDVTYLTNMQLKTFKDLNMLCNGEVSFYSNAADNFEELFENDEDDEPSDIDSFLF